MTPGKNRFLPGAGFALALLISVVLKAQSSSMTEFNFKLIGVEEGLSKSTVNCMLQDRKGFIWIGTSNGLDRYDGYHFTVFVNDPNDPKSLSNNGILSLYEDKDGFIWIGTSEGVLNKYDRKEGSFTRYPITVEFKGDPVDREEYYDFPIPFSRNIEKAITAVYQDENKVLWLGTWGAGLIKFDYAKNKLEYFFFDRKKPEGIHSNRIRSIIPDEKGNLWIGTLGGGLCRISVEGDKINIKTAEHSDESGSLSDNKIFSLMRSRSGDLWIGTFGGGLNKLSPRFQDGDLTKARFEKFPDGPANKSLLSSGIITSILEDKEGYIWVGTYGGGLIRYNPGSRTSMLFVNEPRNPNSLSKNDVFSLMEDKSGVLWIGTFLGKGLNKLEQNKVKFKQISRDLNNAHGLDDDVVWAISEDGNSVAWIGTYKGGLNKFDRRSGKFVYFKKDENNQNSLSDNHIRAIADDEKGSLWIGTYSGGLNKFNKSNGQSIRYKKELNDSTSLGSNQVQALMFDKDKNLWVGTFGDGLNEVTAQNLNKGRVEFIHYDYKPGGPNGLSDGRIYCLMQDRNSIIWVGTFGGGLNRFDPSTGKFVPYKNIPGDESSLSDNRVMTVHEDKSGSIWVGTYGGGLQKFDKQTGKFRTINSKRGINSSVVYGILEDSQDNLWMSTDNGLSRLNLRTEHVAHYDLHDGLQSTEFSGGAYFKSQKGEMFFGGINGLNYFYPDSIRDNNFVPPVVISSLKIFSEPVAGERDSVELSYSQNFFSFEFSALDYTNPVDNRYAYMLEGFDDNWHYVDSRRRSANYTNLSPGEYVFIVRGSNNDGLWNNQGARVYIRILPPFWRRWWFICALLIAISYMIFYFSTLRYRSLLALEKLKGKLAADLHDNVGSGLTEISILSELAAIEMKDIPQDARVNLNAISDKARQLIDSMSDIVWIINPQRDSFYHLILRLKDSYSDLLYGSGISFKTINLEKLHSIKLPMEYKQNLYLIFKEAINNAIKHSGCRKIQLIANYDRDKLELILNDDGKGFDTSIAGNGNGLINMNNRARSIRGKLTIESSPDGTTIKFSGRFGTIKKMLHSYKGMDDSDK